MSLIAISAVNIVAWIVVASRYGAGVAGMDRQARAARRWHLILSAVFVLGCAFRSLLPRAEAQRICLYDSWVSAAVISRAVATVAELSLVAQWTLFLREYARAARVPLALAISRLPLPLIAMAEVFSWYTALTSNFIGSVLEESTWALTAALIIVGLGSIRGHYAGARRRLISTVTAFIGAYFIFMCSVDVPMYWSRWRTDQAHGKHYLSLREGWRDASHRRVVTRSWSDWRDEMPWMSLYFTAGVWISIALVRTPAARETESRRLAV